MQSYNIIDSNILAIANGLHDKSTDECIKSAIDFLFKSMQDDNCIILFDDTYQILNEYQKHCIKKIQQKFGHVFLKWLYQNQTNHSRILKHTLPVDHEKDDSLLPSCFDGFDRNDRKYLILALIIKQYSPTIHYGIDRGYTRYSSCFSSKGIQLNQICAPLH